jgi:hypothetical protein
MAFSRASQKPLLTKTEKENKIVKSGISVNEAGPAVSDGALSRHPEVGFWFFLFQGMSGGSDP